MSSTEETTSAAEILVDVKNLVKTFGPLRAVDDLSFQVKRGEIVGLLGANGAGKSTLMKVLNCYLLADEGTAKVAGISVDDDAVEVRKHIGYLPENAPLYTEMRVFDFLKFVASMRGIKKSIQRERIDWAVERCGLQPKFMANIGTLSRGYRQRVGIAQAILHNPDLLILDEPTSGLDPIQLIDIRRLIMEIGKTNTVFFSTHIMQEVEAVCTRAIIIDRGKLVADGSPTDLKLQFAEKGTATARLRGVEKETVVSELQKDSKVKYVEAHDLQDYGVVSVSLQLKSKGDAGLGVANEAGKFLLAQAEKNKWPVLEIREGVGLEEAFLQASGKDLRKEKSETVSN